MRKLLILALFATFSCNPAFAQYSDNGSQAYEDQQRQIEQDYQNQQMQTQQEQMQRQLDEQQQEINNQQRQQYPVPIGGYQR